MYIYRWDLYSEIPWTVKTSAVYIGAVGKVAMKKNYGRQCLIQVMFSFNKARVVHILKHDFFFKSQIFHTYSHMFTGLNRLEANKGDLHGQDGSNAVHLSKVKVIFVKRKGFVNVNLRYVGHMTYMCLLTAE